MSWKGKAFFRKEREGDGGCWTKKAPVRDQRAPGKRDVQPRFRGKGEGGPLAVGGRRSENSFRRKREKKGASTTANLPRTRRLRRRRVSTSTDRGGEN